MIFRHRFVVRAPLVGVAEFHRQAETLRAITPLLRVRLDQAPTRLHQGGELTFSLWFGPLPLRWRARIDALPPTGFVDRQIRGPFQFWEHRHTFVPLGAEATWILDEVLATPRRSFLWAAVGLGIWLSLPLLFAFRAWKTRRLLEPTR
jgi:ligand-binding SRPBCC domain-containing protein